VASVTVALARRAGARVIGTSSSAQRLAAAHLDYTTEDVAARVRELTAGRGVDVAFEHEGGRHFAAAMAALAPEGRLVTIGAHDGEVVELDVLPFFRQEQTVLGSRGSTHEELAEVFRLAAAGEILDAGLASAPAAGDVHAGWMVAIGNEGGVVAGPRRRRDERSREPRRFASGFREHSGGVRELRRFGLGIRGQACAVRSPPENVSWNTRTPRLSSLIATSRPSTGKDTAARQRGPDLAAKRPPYRGGRGRAVSVVGAAPSAVTFARSAYVRFVVARSSFVTR
jgi:Zinc-binding dehydrogenase